MALSRRLRRWLSGVLALTILFTQIAVAAYVCPTDRAVQQHEHAAVAGMPDCHEIGNDADDAAGPAQSPPQLCKAHCSNDAQSAARTAAPDLQPNPASVALLQRVIEPVLVPQHPVLVARVAPLQGPPDPVPLYLSLLVLRN